MAYEKQTWTTGEVITQEKLNHMEDGIANAGGDAGEERYTYFDISGSDLGGYNTSISQSEIYEMADSGNGHRLVPRSILDEIELKFAGSDIQTQSTKFIGWTFGYWQGTTVHDLNCILYTIPASGSITRKDITIHEEPNPNA